MQPRNPQRSKMLSSRSRRGSGRSLLGSAVLAVILALRVGAVFAQDLPQQSEPAPADPPAVVEVPGSDELPTDGTYARTLSLASDREVEIRLRSAHTAFQIGNSAEGVRVLAELLTLPDIHLVENRSTYRDVRDEINRFLKSSSQELRDQFRRETEVRAMTEFQVARDEGNLPGLLEIVNRYPQTPIARKAVHLLAQQLFDHGRYDAVMQTSRRWFAGALDIPSEVQLSKPLVQLWQQATLATLGPMAANELALQYRAPDGDIPFRIRAAADPVIAPPTQAIATRSNWQVDSPLTEATETLLQEALQLLRRNGVQPQLTSRPLIQGDRVIWRSPTELVCVRWLDGEVLWRVPLKDSIFDDVESWKARPDVNLYQRVKSQLGHRLLRDSVHGQLSSDADRVYCVEQAPDWLTPPDNAKPDEDQEFRVPIPARMIVARSLATGETLWKTHDVWDASHHGFYFYGPPSKQGASLYAVAQQKEQIYLVRMDALTGKLEGASPLGECPHPVQDRRRLNQACPMAFRGGQAICATGAGAVVAFDLYLGRMSWAFRHPRNDNPPPAQFFMQQPVGSRGWQWFHDWREPQLLLSGQTLVYATPDSRLIRGLSAEGGDLLWEVPTDGATLLVGVDASRVLVRADHRIRSYRLTDGSIEVEHYSSSPIVSANWDGTICELFLNNGQRTAWNPVTGQQQTTRTSSDWGQIVSPAGSLQPIQGASVSQLRSVQSIGPHLLEVSALGLSLRNDLASDPLVAEEEGPELDWENAPLVQTIQKLNDWVTAAVPEKQAPRRQRALAQIAHVLESAREWSEQSSSVCGEWAMSPVDRIELRWRLLQRSIRDRRDVDSLSHLLALLELSPTQWEVEVESTSSHSIAERPRTVRLDAALRGVLQQLWNASSEPQRSVVADTIRKWRMRADVVSGGWADPLRTLQFLPEPTVVSLPIDSVARLAAKQFGLLQRAAWKDHSQAASALLQLAEFQVSRGDPQHASALLGRVQRQFAGMSESPNFADLLKTLTQSQDPGSIDWPVGKPVVTSKMSYDEGEYQVPVTVHAERGTPFDRISVLCPGQPQRNFELSIDHSLTWSTNLPTSARNLGGLHWLRRGWALGEFLVLQFGSELYCIPSRKVQGTGKLVKKSDQFLWPKVILPSQTSETQQFVDTLGNDDNRLLASENRLIAQWIGFSQPDTELFDAHGHRRTWVGPVTAGVTCFLQQGMLVCLETATGQELWRRYDMPGEVRCFGDDEVIAVVHDLTHQVDLLSPLDGQTLRSVPLAPRGEILQSWGRQLLLASGQPRAGRMLTPRASAPATSPMAQPDPATPAPESPPVAEQPAVPFDPLQLTLVDLDGIQTVWTRSYPAGSTAFEVDEEWLGVLTAEGKIELLDNRTGELISEFPVERPDGLSEVVAAVTDRMIYVALSGPVTDSRLDIKSRWRWPLVHGPLYAIDRQTGSLVWSQVIENRGLPLGQPRDVPLLVFVDTWKGDDPRGTAAEPEIKKDPKARRQQYVSKAWSRFLVLDSRTGDTLHETAIEESTPHYSFDKNHFNTKGKPPWVDLKLKQRTVRFEYAPPAK